MKKLITTLLLLSCVNASLLEAFTKITNIASTAANPHIGGGDIWVAFKSTWARELGEKLGETRSLRKADFTRVKPGETYTPLSALGKGLLIVRAYTCSGNMTAPKAIEQEFDVSDLKSALISVNYRTGEIDIPGTKQKKPKKVIEGKEAAQEVAVTH